MKNLSDVNNVVTHLTSNNSSATRQRSTGVNCCYITGALILSTFVGNCLALPTNPTRQTDGRSAVESEAGSHMKSTITTTADCSAKRRVLCYSQQNFSVLPAPTNSFESSIIHYDEKSLNTLCSLEEKVRICRQGSSTEKCGSNNDTDAEIRDSVVKFMCDRGRTGYLQHRICLRSAEFTGAVQQCNFTYEIKLAELRNDSSRKTPQKLNSFCRYVDTYVGCVTSEATRTCGSDVGEWVKQFKLNFMQPVKDHLRCDSLGDETSHGKPETPIVMYVVLSILLAMISTLALAMTVRCTGLDHFLLLRPSTPNSTTLGRQHRLPDQQNGDRHLIPSTTASKKKKPLTGKKSTGRMLFRLANIGGRAANGGDCAQQGGVGLANGPGSSAAGSARTKGHRLELPLVSDSSPGTERTVSEMANNNSPHRPLLQTTSSELPLAIDDTGN